MIETLRDLVRSPLAWLTGAFGSAALGLVDPLIAFLNATSGLWLPITLMSEQLAGYVEWLPTDLIGTIVPVVIAVYVGLLLFRFGKRTRQFINNNT